MYKLYKFQDQVIGAYTNNGEFTICFTFAPENTDYQQFKTNVLAGAELQDADGNVMTQAQADAFIATLP